MSSNTWFIHKVFGGREPFGTNIHTHGFEVAYGQPNIQICFPITEDVAEGLIHNVAKLITTGVVIETGKLYDGIVSRHQVQFIEAYESGRKVHRLILPDSNGKFNVPKFADQFVI